MLNNTYTIAGKSYDKTTQNANSSTFSDETVVLTEPKKFFVAHKKRKASEVIDTVVALTNDLRPVPEKPYSRVKVQLKLSYDPTAGIADLGTVIDGMLDELQAFKEATLTSLLNREV